MYIHHELFKLLPSVLLKKSIALSSVGLKEVAWRKDAAIKIVKFITKNGYAILGGDVYSLNAQKNVAVTPDSWYIERDKLILDERVAVSRKIAIDYIKNYYKRNGPNYCFSIVAEERK